MNFDQLCHEASLVDPEDSIVIRCERWFNLHKNGNKSLKVWQLWSDEHHKFYNGHTPEELLKVYKHAKHITNPELYNSLPND